MCKQGCKHSLEFFHALIIIIYKNACDLTMSCRNQKMDQFLCTGVIIDPDPRTVQILIIVIEKNQRNAASLHLLITVEVRTCHTGFYAVHNKSLKVLVHNSLQTPAFVCKLIIRQKNTQIHLPVPDYAANPANQLRLRIAILPLEDQTDLNIRPSTV